MGERERESEREMAHLFRSLFDRGPSNRGPSNRERERERERVEYRGSVEEERET